MISMDVNTIGVMIIMAIFAVAAFAVGYNMGYTKAFLKAMGDRIQQMPAPLFPKKEEFHERDPWDEQRIDIPDKAQVIQTLGEEDRP